MTRIAAILLCTLVSLSAEDENWTDLFDGKTTQGWKPNADEGAYRVEDGLLRLQATHLSNRGHLFYVGDDDELDLFRNFELKVVARGEPDSNSGIFFHTDRETRDKVLHLENGYEVQLNSTLSERRKTGSLYDVIDLTERVIDDTQWFTVRIRVEEKRIQVWLNDKQTIDYTEPPNVAEQRSLKRKGRILREDGGAIALQAHDENSVFYFKSVRIRSLP
tara:strand:- start:207 stop:863 length:657 start_codon:yes stop_codon:yes gene_type:complete